MYILLFLVVAAVLIYQSGRISKIESTLKKWPKEPQSASQTGSKPTQTQAASVAASPVSGAMPAAASTPAVNATPVQGEPLSEESSGRILGGIGIGAVVIGMAFFLKYAFDNNWIGPSGRVVLGLLIGILVMSIGQSLRKKYLNYSDLLMGGGMAILYLSIYSAYGFYHLVDPMLAFMGMIAVTAIGVAISIMNATQTLSAVALIGGFLTPFLIGTGELGPWIVFTYMTILNAGILGILFFKKWTNLVLIGLIGTWLYFGQWLSSSYTDILLVPTLLFILVQFLIFTASSVVRIIVEKIKAVEIDYVVLTVTALSFAGVCYHLLMPQYKDMASVGAVIVAAFYGVVALVAFKENPQDRTINIFLPGLAVAFLTAAVPIEFSGPWIAAWWLIEALVLYVVASNSSSRGFQVMGVVVYVLGLFDVLKYIVEYTRPAGYMIFYNGPFVMLVMATIVAYAIAFMYYHYGSVSAEVRDRGIMAFVIMANIITLYALTSQVTAYYELQQAAAGDSSYLYSQLQNWSNTTVSILWALYAAILTAIGFAKRYAALRRIGLTLFLITAFKVVIDVWSLGQLYRIISFIVFGIIALGASFVYVKYKDRLKEIV